MYINEAFLNLIPSYYTEMDVLKYMATLYNDFLVEL